MSEENTDCQCDPCAEDSEADKCAKIGSIEVGKYASVIDKNKNTRYIPNKENALYYNDGKNPGWKNGSEDERLLIPSLRKKNELESVLGLSGSAMSQHVPDTSNTDPQILAYYNGVLKFHPDAFREACFAPGQIPDKKCGRIALLTPGPGGGFCLVRFEGCDPGCDAASKVLRAVLVDGNGEVSCGTITASDVLPQGEPCQVLTLDEDSNEQWSNITKTITPIGNQLVLSDSGALTTATVNGVITPPSPPALATHIFLRANVELTATHSATAVSGTLSIEGIQLAKAWAQEHAIGVSATGHGSDTGSGLIALKSPNTGNLSLSLVNLISGGPYGEGAGHTYSYTVHADYYCVDVCQ